MGRKMIEMETTLEWTCPHCGMRSTRAIRVETVDFSGPGYIGVCERCGLLSIDDPNGRRKLTMEEADTIEIEADEAIRLCRTVVAALQRKGPKDATRN